MNRFQVQNSLLGGLHKALQFLKSDSFFVMVEPILIMALYLVSFSIVNRIAGTEFTGIWVLLGAIFGFSRAALFWTQGLLSFVSQSLNDGDKHSANQFIITSIVTGFIGNALLGAVPIPFILYFGNDLFGAENVDLMRSMLPVVFVSFIFNSLAGIFQVAFIAHGFNRHKAIINVTGHFVLPSTVYPLYIFYGGLGIVYAQALQAFYIFAVGVGVSIWFAIIQYSIKSWSLEKLKQLVAYGAKAITVTLIQVSFEPIVRILVASVGTLSQVALVELVSRLIGTVRWIISSLGQFLIPRFSSLSLDPDTIRAPYRNSIELYTKFAFAGMSAMIVGAPIASYIAFGEAKQDIYVIFSIFLVGWIINIIAYPANFLLTGQRHLRPLITHFFIMSGIPVFLIITIFPGLSVYVVLALCSLFIGISAIYVIAFIDRFYNLSLSVRDYIPDLRSIFCLIAGYLGVFVIYHFGIDQNIFNLILATTVIMLLVLAISPIGRIFGLLRSLERG